MVPKVVKGSVSPDSNKGKASAGPLIQRQSIFDSRSLEDALGSLSDLAVAGVGIYNSATGQPTAPKPPKPPQSDSSRWLLIGGGALVVIAILFFALRRK